jgi:predicted cobalt transporter CbtA
MMSKLLLRGLLAGLLAGMAAMVFAYVFGEPTVASAIELEGAHAAHEEPEVVSREVQSTAGLATGVLVYGVAFGGLFAMAFAFAYGRLGRLDARATAAVLAAGGFVAVFVVPFLKYPGNPPAVGNPDTIEERTAYYVLMVLASVVLAITAVSVGRRLVPRLGGWNAGIVGFAGYVVAIGLVQLALPTINDVSDEFPAAVLWEFRLASVGTQLVMWAVLGVLFGALAHRQLRSPAGIDLRAT